MMRYMLAFLCGWLAWAGASLASGAVFVLSHGGQIEGELLNPNEPQRQTYIVRTADGGRLVLPAKLVQRVESPSEALKWYQAELPKVPPTAAGHWAMAEECKKRGLKDEREFHLKEVIRLDPEHKDARYALGYSRVEDRWVRTDEFMTAQGYVRHGGNWRIPQEVAMEKAAGETDRQQKDWIRRIKLWRTAIEKPRGKELQARDAIRAIADPQAASALAAIVTDEDAPSDLRMTCIDVLGKLKTVTGVATFTERAMNDSSESVRDACLLQLSKFGAPGAAAVFEKLLRSPDNKKVNRAAHCLGLLKLPESTLALINALVTDHKFAIQTGGSPGQMNLGFGGGPGGGGNSFGVGGRPQIVTQHLQNNHVLNALTAIHPGVNFGYDEDAWKEWYNEKFSPPVPNLRRQD